MFTLCVDNFGVNFVGQDHSDHLMSVLRKHYTISTDKKGKHYLGIDLNWDYECHVVHLSMLSYVPQACKQFNHPMPRRAHNQPHPLMKPKYGTAKRFSPDADTLPLLDADGKKYVQEVVALSSIMPVQRTAPCRLPRAPSPHSKLIKPSARWPM